MTTLLSEPRWLAFREKKTSAAEILRQFGCTDPAVPVGDLTAWLGIPVTEVSNPGWSGALRVNEEARSAKIWLRAEDARVRRRFTLAHELGHLLLAHGDKEYRDAPAENGLYVGSPLEAQANRFAADLLMPVPWVNAYGAMLDWNPNTMAKRFDVSPAAMGYRIQSVYGS